MHVMNVFGFALTSGQQDGTAGSPIEETCLDILALVW
jgi:hypothetical protein